MGGRGNGSLALTLIVGCLASCTLIANADLKAGIGQACATDSDCQASSCSGGVCTLRCGQDKDCPLQAICVSNLCKAGCNGNKPCPTGQYCNAQNQCSPALLVAAIFPGDVNGGDGWSTSQKLGLDTATGPYPQIQFPASDGGTTPYAYSFNVTNSTAMDMAIDGYARQGANVIFTTSDVGTAEAISRGPRYATIDFIASGATTNGNVKNIGAYTSDTEEGWYLAGRLAARVASSGNKCIGLVLPTPTHAIVRDTNAFALGANYQQPGTKVVIRWLGGAVDPSAQSYGYKATTYPYDSVSGGDARLYREELLTAQLLDLGCQLVGHRTQTQRVVAEVDRLQTRVNMSASPRSVFSMGVDFANACYDNFQTSGTWYDTCLGTLYWDWSPLYSKIFGQIVQGVWMGGVDDEPFRSDTSALLKYALSPFPSITGIQANDVAMYTIDAANKGVGGIFTGPITFNGQRDLNADGVADPNQTLAAGTQVAPEELGRMCWFVAGTYELPAYQTVTYSSLIPAMVPYGPSVTGQTTTLTTSAADQMKYGDVIQFITAQNEDPTMVMSCASSP